MTDLTLYCNCFNERLNRSTQFNQKNLMCGASSLDGIIKADLQSKQFLFDDSGDNISNLNTLLGDLTGLYWVWKNTSDEFVGTNQYRRFWNETDIKNSGLKSNTIYVSNPIRFGDDVITQYTKAHGPLGLQILNQAIKHGKVNMTEPMLHNMKNVGCLSACNMFFGERKVFDRTCEILFDIIFEMYEGSKYVLPYNTKYQLRTLAYMAERILNIIYLNKNHYYGNIDIVPVQVHMVE